MNRVKWGSGWEHLLEIARIVGFGRAYTWNPAVGCHGIGCEVHKRGVCWAEGIAKRFKFSFEPHLIPERLNEPRNVRKRAVITPVSMGDLFGQKPEDIAIILTGMDKCRWHIFALLTKLPQYAFEYNPFADNVWFGVTVNNQADVWRLDLLRKIDAPKKYCMFEPLYSAIDYDLAWLDLIVVGPQTKPLVQPKKEWVQSVLNNALGVHIFMKSTLKG